MIKKAQIKFIAIVMAILLCVFLVVFGVYCYFLNNTNNLNIDKKLNDIKEEVTAPNAPPEQYYTDTIILISRPLDGSTQTTKRYDTNSFTEAEVNSIIKKIANNNASSGIVEGYIYYRAYIHGTTNILVACDMSDTLAVYSRNIFSTSSILLFVYAVLFFVVWILSLWVFKPIRESFVKQRQFISNASHELKTPVAIISANADVISGNSNPYVESIKNQTNRMSVLIGDMLSLAKMDERQKILNPILFNLSEEITSATLSFDAIAFENGKELQTEIENDLMYKGDVHSVKNLVNILLDNSVKHANIGGKIIVKLKKENGKIILTVFNTGSTVPDQDSNKVFERFYRPDDSRSRDSGGSGLGLAIAKGIADTNKWKIFARSKLNESMTITVIFL